MSQIIRLKKGFDIRLVGKAEKKIDESIHSDTYAIKPSDFPGMIRPKVIVKEGDNVEAGTPILFDKKAENILYTSLISGEIAAIRRGEKRKLLEIIILADKQVVYKKFKKYTTSDILNISQKEAKTQMLESGVWPQIIQRPYAIVADPEDTPKNIFVSAFDSHPLAPDYNFIFKGEEKYLQAGFDLLKKFTRGNIYLNIHGEFENSSIFSKIQGVQINRFFGPHPAGNVGVQIHHIRSIGKDDIVWTLNVYGVIQIGKLFLEGIYDASKIIALTGSEIKDPKYYKTYMGTCVKNFLKKNLKQEHIRTISGNVLTGEKITRDGYLGYYDHQFTVIPEGDKPRFFLTDGWLAPIFKRLSFHRAWGLFSFLNSPKKEYILDSNSNGEKRTFVMTGAFEKVVPMDIFPTHLIKAIMAEDYDEMEELGIYEVAEEDLALCEFIDVSKHDIQSFIRKGINLMKEG